MGITVSVAVIVSVIVLVAVSLGMGGSVGMTPSVTTVASDAGKLIVEAAFTAEVDERIIVTSGFCGIIHSRKDGITPNSAAQRVAIVPINATTVSIVNLDLGVAVGLT